MNDIWAGGCLRDGARHPAGPRDFSLASVGRLDETPRWAAIPTGIAKRAVKPNHWFGGLTAAPLKLSWKTLLEVSAMSKGMSRREFLKYSGATAVALTTIGTGTVYANNPARYWTYGFDEERFGEETLIKKAIGIAVNRMQEVHVRRNAYNVASYASITGSVMDNSNLRNTRENR